MKKIFAMLFLITLLSGAAVYATPIRGDADGDGRLTSMDATVIARYLAGHFDHDPNHFTQTEQWRWIADAGCDGYVSTASLTRLGQLLVGQTDMLCPDDGCDGCDPLNIPPLPTAEFVLGTLPIGSIVYLRENGVPAPFIVVQQGRPAGLLGNGNFNRPLRPRDNAFANNNQPITAYASWTNSTILMRQNVLNPMLMGNAQNLRNVFSQSSVRAWLNGAYFNSLDADIRSQVINKSIPVIDCGVFHTLGAVGNQSLGIGDVALRMFVTTASHRVWIPHAAEVGVPWGTENSNHTAAGHAFPNSLSVLHWLPGAGTTWQQWNNTIRFAYFPFGHGTNPSLAVANTASARRIARCDDGIPRTWWTRCPGNQISGVSPWGVAVGTDGTGHLHSLRNEAWVRPTMGFPNTLTVSNNVLVAN
ncbi:MAG: DUF6273 domain-containing protein [Defluviitaleaceae bacterium]|nr:DUF6273 domain-containing protein [Defluviitaleaceae bacterium]MCL2262082.1 DUF6273 domain-containing protein [Defluviitaleaceae bacterium]